MGVTPADAGAQNNRQQYSPVSGNNETVSGMKSHAETDADFQKAADSGTEREDATGQKNNDQELNAVIKKLESM